MFLQEYGHEGTKDNDGNITVIPTKIFFVPLHSIIISKEKHGRMFGTLNFTEYCEFLSASTYAYAI